MWYDVVNAHPRREQYARRSEAERTFGRDVDRVRLERFERVGEPSAGQEREADLGVARAGQRAVSVGRYDRHGVAASLEHSAGPLQCRDHAVDLRQPGIRHQGELHSQIVSTRSL